MIFPPCSESRAKLLSAARTGRPISVLGVTNITNYIYWDQEALPQLYDQNLMIFSAYFSRHFKLSGFNSDNKILVQHTTAADVLRLPLASAYTSNYWKQSLFKGALVADVGFDLIIPPSTRLMPTCHPPVYFISRMIIPWELSLSGCFSRIQD